MHQPAIGAFAGLNQCAGVPALERRLSDVETQPVYLLLRSMATETSREQRRYIPGELHRLSRRRRPEKDPNE